MHEYPNIIQQSLEQDVLFNKELQQSIVKKFNDTPEVFFASDKFETKIIENSAKKLRYLLIKNILEQKLTIYEENISSWNKTEPFKYILSSLKEKGKVYSSNKNYTFLLNSSNKFDDIDDKEFDGILSSLENIKNQSQEKATELLAKLKKLMKRDSNDPDYFVASSSYNFKSFSSFFGVIRPDSFWVELSSPLNFLIDKKVGEFSIAIKYLFDVVKEQSFNEKNKYTFNDLDNHLWKKANGIVFDDQNLGFLCLKQDNSYKNYTIYAYDKEGNNCKFNNTLAKLLKDLKENGENLINNVALKVENGKITFVDNALIYCLDLDILYTKNSLIQEGFGNPSYPIDIYSYEYQLSYYQKTYKMSEIEFIHQALLTLGGGFNYDQDKGRFFDNGVIYSPDIVNYKLDKLDKPDELGYMYGYPTEFVSLNPSWTLAVEKLLKVLKEDRPLPIAFDDNQKEDKLNEIIEFYEKKVTDFSSKKMKP